jgi:hypothetical protein
MNLKCSTYGPEHKTERLRSIGVIVNFWEPVEVTKNCVRLDILLKKSLNIQVFMVFNFSKGSKKIFIANVET